VDWYGLTTPPGANVPVSEKQVSNKQVFSADQVQMHAKHADGPERITAVCHSPDFRVGTAKLAR